jgi:hypothetical protein
MLISWKYRAKAREALMASFKSSFSITAKLTTLEILWLALPANTSNVVDLANRPVLDRILVGEQTPQVLNNFEAMAQK